MIWEIVEIVVGVVLWIAALEWLFFWVVFRRNEQNDE